MSTSPITRRSFINNMAVAGAAVTAAPLFNIQAQTPRKFRVGVVGTGGRGRGAIDNIIEAGKVTGHEIEIYSVVDFFPERTDGTARRFNIPKERVFSTPDGYHKLMEQPIDIVILATPPNYRPLHLEAAVKAGKHVFCEKPVGVDPVGVRKVIELGEEMKKKGLSLVAGTQRRHQGNYLRNHFAISQGAIGKIVGGTVSWCQGQLWFRNRNANENDASYMTRNWTSFLEMSGDHIVEQHVHNIDVANWFLGRTPQSALGFGGRARRQTGNQFDFFSVDFNYGEDVHIHSMCRQISGCDGNVSESFTGTEGSAFGGGRIRSAKLDSIRMPEIKTHDNPYVQEHVDLLDAIVKEKPINEARQVAESTMTAIMGRIAAYTGQMVRWSDLMTNAQSQWYNLTVSPSAADFEKGTVVAPKDNVVPVPGGNGRVG